MTAPFVVARETPSRCCVVVMVSAIKVKGLNYGRPLQVMAMMMTKHRRYNTGASMSLSPGLARPRIRIEL